MCFSVLHLGCMNENTKCSQHKSFDAILMMMTMIKKQTFHYFAIKLHLLHRIYGE